MSNYTPSDLSKQVQTDYLDYAVATLTRAIPDIRDGLIPSRRRILQTMLEQGLLPSKPYVKCARTTGMTSALYHPHGSCYGSLISMATPWNNTLPWVDVHGNVGSTVDPCASERYLENRLTEAALDILLDNKDTWITRDNYDSSRQEAVVLDSKVPTVLLNGTEGISVGYSTKWPQHNLRDICDAVVSGSRLVPDWPTGCQMVEDAGLDEYVNTGSGSLRLRAILEVGTLEKQGRAKERATLTYTNLPPGTNPEKIGQQVKVALEKGQIDGIAEVIDLTDMGGDRVQIVAKPGISAINLEGPLWMYTDLETTFAARNLCLDDGRPVTLSSAEVITRWKTWRLERLKVQFAHERDLKESRLEIVMGLLKALTRLDAVIAVIRSAATPKDALIELVTNRSLKFTRDQAQAVLDMRLRSLTGLDAEALEGERVALEGRLEVLTALVASEADRTKHLVAEVKALGKRHGETRRSALTVVEERVRSERGPSTPRVAKPRYVVVDTKKGVVTQGRGPRGAMIFEPGDKLIVVTQDGTLRKLPATFKGPVAATFQPTLLARKEADVANRKYILVFEHEHAIRAMCVEGVDLCRVTSKGKQLLPGNSTILHFGEDAYTVKYKSTRKKATVVDTTIKVGKPGGKGVKVANVANVAM